MKGFANSGRRPAEGGRGNRAIVVAPTRSRPVWGKLWKGESGIDPVWFINKLRHTKGTAAGQTFKLRPWQKAIVEQLFRKRRDGRRQYRTCLLMLPRKNGKSELAAALALYGLLADGEQGAEVYSAAADKEQASLVFKVAAQMIRNDAELDARLEISDSMKRMVYRTPQAENVYRALSADAYSKHGFNASVVVYDELHAAPNRELYDVLSTSMGARKQPLLLVISTAGYDRHSILWELYAHAKKVQENPALDPSFLPILYEAPEDADWTDEAVWHSCNPALDDFRSLEEMRIAAARAKEIPAQENTFRRLYLNQWTEQASRWIQMTAWDACLTPIDRKRLYRKRLYVGMDLSSTLDLSALVGVIPDASGFDVIARCFIPQERIRERVRRDRVPYDEWARTDVIQTIPGVTIDTDAIRLTLKEWAKEFEIAVVAYDPWNATDLVTKLEKQDGFTCVAVRQGFASLSAPTKSLEQAILAKRLRHDGDPVLRWCVSNVAVEQDAAGNLKPSKAVSTERIDAVVALVMAVDAMNRHAAIPQPQYQVMVVG